MGLDSYGFEGPARSLGIWMSRDFVPQVDSGSRGERLYSEVGLARGGTGAPGCGWVSDAQWVELDSREYGRREAYDLLALFR